MGPPWGGAGDLRGVLAHDKVNVVLKEVEKNSIMSYIWV